MADKREVKVLLVKPGLHQKLKVLAAKEGTTIQALTEEAIMKVLADRECVGRS